MSTESTSRRLLAAVFPALAALAAIALVTLWGSSGSEILDRTIITMLIDLVLVMGLYIFAGNSGIFSFGQLSFMAIGAYAAGFLTIPVITKRLILPGLPDWLMTAQVGPVAAVLIGGAVAALFAAVLAIPLMRLSGISASLATFAVLIAINVVLANSDDVTGGTSGLNGVPVTVTSWNAFAWAAVAIAIALAFQLTPIGRRLRATREDEVAARALGISVLTERRVGFVLSAFVTGVGGALYAQFNSAFTPDAFYLDLTFLIIAMLVVGGMNSLTGAVAGVLVLTAVSEGLRRIEQGAHVGPLFVPGRTGLREVGLALIMLAILLFRPRGLTGGRELPLPRRLTLPGRLRRPAKAHR